MRALGSAVNNDYDLDNSGSGAAVYNAAPDASNARWVAFDVAVGDGSKNLDGTGGDFELDVVIGSAAFDGATQTKTVDAGTTRARFQTVPLLVPANATVTITLTSPNAADSDVDVTVQAYDVAPLQPTTVGRTLAVASGGQSDANVTHFGGDAGTFASGVPAVNATHIGSTAQTGRDIGASVLLSSGTGTGQISLSGGTVTVGTNNDKTGYSLTNLTVSSGVTLASGTHNPQSGDAYGIVNNGTHGNAALDSDLGTLLSRLTATRAGYLDKLNITGTVASQADVTALNQSASRRLTLTVLDQFERPDAEETNTYTLELRTYDGDGAAANADSEPTLSATGSVNGDLSGNLSEASNPATGVYRWTYDVEDDADIEEILWEASATIDGGTFTIGALSQVCDFVSATWTTDDASRLSAIYDKLPSRDYLAGTSQSTGAVDASDKAGYDLVDAPNATAIAAIQDGLSTASALTTVGDNVSAVKTQTDKLDFTGTGGMLKSESTNMRGTDGAYTGTPPTVQQIRAEIDANSTKTGYKLASDGLDEISAAIPNGVATTFRGRLMQLFGRFFLRTANDKQNGVITTYRADGDTPNTVQSYTADDEAEDVGAAEAPE